MLNPTIEKELHLEMEALPHTQQRQVLEFARALAITRPRGVPGKDLLNFAGTIAPDDLKLMAEAIEEGCGKVDADGW